MQKAENLQSRKVCQMSPICVTLNTHSIEQDPGGDVDQKGSYAACHGRAEEGHQTQARRGGRRGEP